MANRVKPIRVLLRNVRLSYPNLVRPASFMENSPKYSASFIIDPSTKQGNAMLDDIEDGIDALTQEQWKGKIKRLSDDKIPLHDGNDRDHDGAVPEEYKDMMYLTASSSEKKQPELVCDGKSVRGDERAEDIFYAGCYVNAIVELWAQDEYKRVNASLLGVEFFADGDRLGSSGVTVDDFNFNTPPHRSKFDAMVDEDDDDDRKGRSRSRSRGDDRKGRSRSSNIDNDYDDDDDDDRRDRSRSRSRDDDDDDDDRKGRSKSRSRSRDDDDDDDRRERSRSRSRDDDDDDDDRKGRSKSRSRSRDDDDDDDRRERSRSRSRDDDDDEDDDRPSRKRSNRGYEIDL